MTICSVFAGDAAGALRKGRRSLTLTVTELSALTLGALIALFERTVGYYAELVHVNAYHQPGVEAGKRAAASVLSLQNGCWRLSTTRRALRPSLPAEPKRSMTTLWLLRSSNIWRKTVVCVAIAMPTPRLPQRATVARYALDE